MAKKKEEKVAEEITETKAETEETSVVEQVVETAADAVETVVDTVAETASDVVDAAADTVSDVVETVAETATDAIDAVTGNDSGETTAKGRKRAEKVGVVWSDKMTNTVTVRVDRQVKHPLYHKYIKRKKKFMAHDEMGATVGDKVRIVETRPLSAKKRWRVVEIIQKAEK